MEEKEQQQNIDFENIENPEEIEEKEYEEDENDVEEQNDEVEEGGKINLKILSFLLFLHL